MHDGDRVEMTELARREFPRGPHTGVVVGEARSSGMVRVRRDGNKTVQLWSRSMWWVVEKAHA